ncbi:MAG: hypothetical protein JWP61_762 [Friedmanniella sp.]|nr:hypothetical protein [Friedmanniella sp.]
MSEQLGHLGLVADHQSQHAHGLLNITARLPQGRDLGTVTGRMRR